MALPTDDPLLWATGTNYSAGPYAGQPNKNTPPSGNITEGFNPGAGLITSWLNALIGRNAAWVKAFKNALVDGTLSMKALAIDATGGSAVSQTPGTISASGLMEAANFSFNSPVTVGMWAHGNWVPVAGGGGWTYASGSDSWTSAAAANNIAIPIPIPVGPAGTHTLTQVTLRMKKAGTSTTTLTVRYLDGLSSTGGDPVAHSAGTATSASSGNQIVQVTGLSIATSTDKYILADVNSANTGDQVFGVYAEWTQTHAV